MNSVAHPARAARIGPHKSAQNSRHKQRLSFAGRLALTRLRESSSSVKTAWRAACRRAGITDLRFHDLRHEAASRFVEAGWPLHVQEMLGHSNLKQTSTYVKREAGGPHRIDAEVRPEPRRLQTHPPPTHGLFATTRRLPTPTHTFTEG
jgi:integrase